MGNSWILYHGSNTIVETPDLSIGREAIDFGKGFYLTEDFAMSAKWACRKDRSVVNKYSLNLEGLNVYTFTLDKTWLDFVSRNRRKKELSPELEKIARMDVLIGAVADDRLFRTIDLYEDGLITAERAIAVMNCMNHNNQIVLKTQKAVDNLALQGYRQIVGQEKNDFLRQFKTDNREASRRTNELLRQFNESGISK